jgi:hypothetical protein
VLMLHPLGANGMILFGVALKLFLLMVVAAALLAGRTAGAVQVNSAAQGVQLKEGCAGESAEVCGLRMRIRSSRRWSSASRGDDWGIRSFGWGGRSPARGRFVFLWMAS